MDGYVFIDVEMPHEIGFYYKLNCGQGHTCI